MKIMQVVFVVVSVAVLFCQCVELEGYTVNEATGHAYKIMYKAENWTTARDTCADSGAKLAVPKSQDEFLFIQKLVRGIQYADITGSEYKLLVWLGINNLDNYKILKNIDGENVKDTGFHNFVGWDPDDSWPGEKEPHCVGMDAANPGLRIYWCHRPQAYVCQKNI